MTRGWWQPQKEIRYRVKMWIALTYEEFAALEYFKKQMKMGAGAIFRMVFAEWISKRSAENAAMHAIVKRSTWDKIQDHMASGKWHGLPEKWIKVTQQPNLEPRRYAAAAYAYGVHPDLAQLLSDYGLELQRAKATDFVRDGKMKAWEE